MDLKLIIFKIVRSICTPLIFGCFNVCVFDSICRDLDGITANFAWEPKERAEMAGKSKVQQLATLTFYTYMAECVFPIQKSLLVLAR